MLRFMGRMLAAALLLIAYNVNAQVVISQVYGGGGSTGAAYRSDFVELHNNGNTTVDLTGWSLQYTERAYIYPVSWQSTNLGGSIAPGGYYLIELTDGNNTTAAPLPTPDAIGGIVMNNAGGTLSLRTTQAVSDLAGCPQEMLGQPIVDVVGFGTADCSEYLPAPALTDTTSLFRLLDGCTDYGNNLANFTTSIPMPRNSQSAARLCNTGPLPVLSINDSSKLEGNGPGTTSMGPFVATLSAPAGPAGVKFSARMVSVTATGTDAGTVNADYISASWQFTIPAGGQSASGILVPIYGDTKVEADETFQIVISNVTGAIEGDLIATGTILNDDSHVITPISQIQGSGTTSPLNGQSVMTEGVVTAIKRPGNAFFMQSMNDDGNPATSEGLFVRSSGLPSWLQVGARIRVSGEVREILSSGDPAAATITYMSNPATLDLLESGVALPEAITLTGADLAPGSAIDNVEKYESMRVRIDGARVVGASTGFIDEITATAATAGIFRVVLPGVPRTFREPGIDVYDAFPIPVGKAPPRFDHNNERITVRSNGQLGAPALAVNTGATVNDMTGVLDYYLGSWALLPDSGSGTVIGSITAQSVSNPRFEDVTIGSFNLFRFFDEVDDSNGAPVLTPEALDKRLTKTALAICDYLKTPDIVGIVDAENLRVLDLLAERINTTCAAAPAYATALLPGNDASGTNVGFLFSRRIAGGQERIVPSTLSQLGKNEVFANPDGTTTPLFDRPPLMMNATVVQSTGASYPLTIIVNDLQSIADINIWFVGDSNGWATIGERVRAKRASQALYLANFLQLRQLALPNERIVVLGNFNAYGFNDGYVDVMGILRGNAAAEDQVITHVNSPLTSPLIDGAEFIIDPTERYAQMLDGNALTFDHVLLNSAVVTTDAEDIRVEHARINADFGTHRLGEPDTAIRASNRDPVRVAISVPSFRSADLGVAVTSSPATVHIGETIVFTATVGNAGPNDAMFASIALVFDALVSPSVTAPAGWTCAAPTQDVATTTVTCTTPSLVAGGSVMFSASVVAGPELGAKTLTLAAATTSQIIDPANGNNQASASVEVLAANSDLSAAWSGGPTVPFRSGTTSHFTLTVANTGPNDARQPTVTITGDAPSANIAIVAPAGWTCVIGGDFQAVCQASGTLAVDASATFDVAVTAPPRDDDGLTLVATASAQGTDPNAGNNSASRHENIIGAPRSGGANPKK